ncbi:type I polyketide synthase [Hydrocoleum sp. CS-953]|uniref:type I polyketide synthase n=3 Tax=Hydrocoleum sp. CS-953 TaxID=1671698 RepID=UPI001FEF78C0|nr:type I polyketide synthase [Hydrocoleum sp. CS-953]
MLPLTKTSDVPNKELNMEASSQTQLSNQQRLFLELQEATANAELSNQQRLLLAVKHATARLNEIETASTEPIAIIGTACRFPGGADTPESYWEFLRESRDGRVEIPKERWNNDQYYNPDPEAPGKIYVRHGYFLQQPVDQFDPAFFGISGAEANKMDPSQRLLLEVSWEALENAGISPRSLKNTETGVYIGQCFNDYALIGINSLPNNLADFYLGLGTGMNISSGRIAYVFGLQGPTLTLDTTCSSSLVTLHIACQGLRNGESNLALVGGVNLMLHPTVTHGFCKSRGLSPDSRCKTFDASADGFARGEGCSIIVLKRLRDAVADGDRILALVKGSAINHDGPSSGLTVPNQQAQKKVLRQALANAKVNPSEVDYVECHGTGTSLGDPLEVKAIDEVYCQERSKDDPLILGAVKSNVGHLEAAAGVAGLMKIILALQNKEIPPNLHFNKPNPQIDWDKISAEVATSAIPWEKPDKPLLAGISGFGMSGTNAHAILQSAPEQVKSKNETERSLHVLTLSARTQKALADLVVRYQNYLEKENNEDELGDICYTANIGRAHLNQRLAVIAANKAELLEKLTAEEIFSGQVSSSTIPKVAFLFTGQGSQYVNMGRELYEQAPVFRQAIERCNEIFSAIVEEQEESDKISLLDVMYSDTEEDSSPLHQTAYTQPALFAIEYALAKLWESWGIKPNVVMGHSVGEYVAATIAGIFSLEDGLKLITARGRLMQELPPGGEMVSVMASESKVRPLLTNYTDKVAMAAINGPASVVISGESEAVRAIATKLESEGIKTKQLQVSHAFHSPLMEPMLEEFEEIANQLDYKTPRIPVISNVTGTKADSSITTAKYWVDHVRQPVKFAQSMDAVQQQGIDIFLEVGPKPILLGMGRRCLPEDAGEWLPSLRPNVDEWQQILSSLSELYVRGAKIDWSGFDGNYQRQKVALPTYPFQRQRYWIENEKSGLSESTLTQITDTATETLTKQLAETGNLSESELELVPKILELLKQQQFKPAIESEQKSTESEDLVSPSSVIDIEKLQAAPVAERKLMVVEYLQKLAIKVLQLNTSEGLDLNESVLELGFDSLSVVELRSKIEKQLAVTIPASLILQGPSIMELAEALVEQLTDSGSDQTPVEAKKEGGWIAYHKPKPNASTRLFCFHPWGASASIYQQWSDALPPEIEVLPIQLPGRQRRLQEQPFTDFASLIEVLADVLSPYLDKPFAFFGHSMGAFIAFELAYFLEEKHNLKPMQLFLSGVVPPSDNTLLEKIESLSEAERLNYLLEISEIPKTISEDPSLFNELMNIFKADFQLLKSYYYHYVEKKPLNCPISSFSGVDDNTLSDRQLSHWSEYTNSNLKIDRIPGKHMFMFLKDSQKLLLELISQELLPELITQ